MDTVPNDITRVLVVGSWAKEQITIENIRQNSAISVFSYLSTPNPAILSQVQGYSLGGLDEKERIIDFAQQHQIDLVLITTAQPLSVGVVDALEREHIPVFGPNQTAAQLEYDKAFTRQLMKKHSIEALPQFCVCTDPQTAIQSASDLDWKVAIKPIGLTEGLGVKISGDQLKNQQDGIDYIHEIFDKGIGGEAKVLVEEKLEGDEFTIQCFVYKDHLIPTPAVRDFKRLLPGDRGPNTASMGSYSHRTFLLPFITQAEYDTAVTIMRETISAFQKETGYDCKGFLYGQFMKTTQGIKLIEYNFRPGDPEWMNTVMVLRGNLLDIITRLMAGERPTVRFDEKATVCKYIVPPRYPQKMDQILDVQLQMEQIQKLGVQVYYSCGRDAQGKLRVGSERGIALCAKADTVTTAHEMIEQAIPFIQGTFHYRQDIGSQETSG